MAQISLDLESSDETATDAAVRLPGKDEFERSKMADAINYWLEHPEILREEVDKM